MVGKKVLQYTLERLLGEGGMGSVYLARHAQLDRKVAVKVLNANLVSNAHIRERFKNEAATLATLQHPGIVALYDYLEEPDGLYLIMEFVEGLPLQEYIRQVSGPVPETKAVLFFNQVLDAVGYAHRKGLVHRDIKPSNLMVAADETVKVLDFGIARLLNQTNHRLTQAGARLGTVLYMSPEQVKGEAVDQRSDVYSLGVTLFETLTGRPPYDENTLSEYEVYERIVNQPLPLARTFYPGVSDRMQALITKATAKNPADRFPDCAAFKEALLAKSPLPFSPTPAVKKQSAPPPITPPTPPSTGKPPVSSAAKPLARKRSSWLNWVIGLVLLLGIAFGVSQLIPGKGSGGLLSTTPEPLSIPETASKAETQDILQQRVGEFYRAMETHNFDKLQPYYAPVVTRYFDKYNQDMNQVRAISENYWQKTAEDRHEIDGSKFTYTRDANGNYVITFPLNYHYRRSNADAWKMQRTGVRLKMNEELRIFYFTGN